MTCGSTPVCKTSNTCQANGTCGGGANSPANTSCGTNGFCDGGGMCKCRQKSAANRLTNPGFDGDALGWELPRGNYRGTAGFDADGCSGSGSINLQATGAEFSQCVQVNTSVPTRFYLAFRYKGSGNPLCTMASHTDDGCNPGQETSSTTDFSHVGNGTTWIQGSMNAVTEAGTSHLRVSCQAATGVGAYDQLYLSTTMPPPTF